MHQFIWDTICWLFYPRVSSKAYLVIDFPIVTQVIYLVIDLDLTKCFAELTDHMFSSWSFTEPFAEQMMSSNQLGHKEYVIFYYINPIRVFSIKNKLLTHLLLVLHICVSESGQHWLRLWFVAYSAPSHYQNQTGLLSIEPFGVNFREILSKIHINSFTKMHLKISSAKWRSFNPGGDE